MKRRALIISNPGEQGAENYCEGVNLDVRQYRDFLTSACGGFWGSSAIKHLPRPSIREVRIAMEELTDVDYSLIIFTGHGWFSTTTQSTILTLREGQEIEHTDLMDGPPRQTLILDCCRENFPGLPLDEMIRAKAAMFSAGSLFHPKECRRYYKQQIEDCAAEIVVMYSCSSGQRSGDDSQRGGVYSYNLIRSATKWADNVDIDTNTTYKTFSVVQAHEQAETAVQSIRRGRQTPQLEKPRSGPYFPFCIVA